MRTAADNKAGWGLFRGRRPISGAVLQLWTIKSLRVLMTMALLTATSGCGTMVASSGIRSFDEIPVGLRRAEVHARFGAPVSASTSAVGRAVEVFHVRHQLNWHKVLAGELECWARGWCFVLWPIVLGAAVYQSESNRLPVAFIYVSEGRSLYHYPVKAESSFRYYQAIRNLAHPILDADEFSKCASITECMKAYVEEAHRRAKETGHDSDADMENTLRAQLEIAARIAQDQLSRDDAVKEITKLSGDPPAAEPLNFNSAERARRLYELLHPLTEELLKKLNQDECEDAVRCVTQYHAEVRASASAIGYLLTPLDGDFLAEELAVAEGRESGSISREELIGDLQGITTRHLIRLYQASL